MNAYKANLMQSILPEWNLFYVDFDYLEELINIRRNSQKNKAAHEEKIANEVESQLLKVNTYFHHIISELESKINNFQVNLNSNTIGKSKNSREHVQLEMNSIQKFFNNISSFCEVNYDGFCKIIEYHDSATQNRISPWFSRRLKEQSFYQYSLPLGNLLLRFSDCCTQARLVIESSNVDFKSAKKGQSYQSFVRETRKYLVKKEDLMKVKSEIVKHLPIYLFKSNCKSKEEIDASPIHSVYFENPDTMEIYSNRLRKTEGAYCIRFRTYNHPKYLANYPTKYHNLAKPKTVFIERKTHHENWVDDNSIKERLEIDAGDVYDFLKGKYSINDYLQHLQQLSYSQKEIEESAKLFIEIQTAMRKNNLVPTITTQYDRTAYQLDGDASVRISIDSNLTLIKERLKISPNWFKENMEIEPDDAYVFQYAVLEVKLQTHQGVQAPEWVRSLVSSNLVRRVEYFSKYIHGCCMLLPSKVPLLPHWIKEFPVPSHQNNLIENIEIKNENENEDDRDSFLIEVDQDRSVNIQSKESILNKKKEKEYFIRALEYIGVSVLDTHNDVPVTVPAKIEPKTFFANERTFLKWMTICLFIQAAGVAFLGFTDFGLVSVTSGVTLIIVSVLFMTYALVRYKIRAYRIKYHQAERYDDVYGPVALFAVLSAVVLTNAMFYIAEHILKEEARAYYAD